MEVTPISKKAYLKLRKDAARYRFFRSTIAKGNDLTIEADSAEELDDLVDQKRRDERAEDLKNRQRIPKKRELSLPFQ